jgi:hypothetical protein
MHFASPQTIAQRWSEALYNYANRTQTFVIINRPCIINKHHTTTNTKEHRASGPILHIHPIYQRVYNSGQHDETHTNSQTLLPNATNVAVWQFQELTLMTLCKLSGFVNHATHWMNVNFKNKRLDEVQKLLFYPMSIILYPQISVVIIHLYKNKIKVK